MLLLSKNPAYNTIIVFTIIMLILYFIKPEFIYSNSKHEFKQFGTTKGKTIFPIYVVAIILAIVIYLFFYNWKMHHDNDNCNDNNHEVVYNIPSYNNYQLQLQQQIQALNTQLQLYHAQLQNQIYNNHHLSSVDVLLPNKFNV